MFALYFKRRISFYNLRDWYGKLAKPKQLKPPYKHIVQIGDPTLRQNAEHVPTDIIQSKVIQGIINRMKEVYHKYNSCGLSAPQIGVTLQIMMFGLNRKHLAKFTPDEIRNKQMKQEDLKIVINPVIKITDYTKVSFPESCESIRGFHAEVPRFQSLILNGTNELGQDFSLEATGWTARIIQHEMDHLSGKLYTDIMDRKTLTCGCWNVINERNGGVILPYRP